MRLMRSGLLQGWDLALTVLQSYRDALPDAPAPGATNGRTSRTTTPEESLLPSAYSLTVHLIIVEIVATSHTGSCAVREGCLRPAILMKPDTTCAPSIPVLLIAW